MLEIWYVRSLLKTLDKNHDLLIFFPFKHLLNRSIYLQRRICIFFDFTQRNSHSLCKAHHSFWIAFWIDLQSHAFRFYASRVSDEPHQHDWKNEKTVDFKKIEFWFERDEHLRYALVIEDRENAYKLMQSNILVSMWWENSEYLWTWNFIHA